LQYVLSFLVVLAVVIVVHELGHYWVARWCGVKVLRFSVGFGKTLLMTRRGPDRTEWALSAIPFGGYVKMLDGREGAVAPAERHRAFDQQSVGKRMAIVAAGPAANFVLAFVVYTGTFMHGFQEPKAIVGAPPESSVAAQAGFRDREEIVSIGGRAVHTWADVRWELIDRAVSQEAVRIETVDAANRMQTRRLDLQGIAVDTRDGDPLANLGLRLFRPPIAAVIGVLEAGKPAAAAGLRVGDRVVGVDGRPVADWQAFVQTVVASPGRVLDVEVERDGRRLSLDLTPAVHQRGNETIGRVGAGVREDPDAFKGLYVQHGYGLLEAVPRAAAKTWDMSVFSLRMLWKMLVGELSWRNLGGPVTIADYAGQSAALGWLPFVTFIALVSISIGVLNLLPIPILDGGHLLYYLVEFVKGSPLSDRVMEAGQRVGFAILLVLMGFAFYNDISRFVAS